MSGQILLFGSNPRPQGARRYTRAWSTWPCRAERGRIVPLSLKEALESSSPPRGYDPFAVYFAAKRGDELPHHALARCGRLQMEDLASLGERHYAREDKRQFFSRQGCSADAALAFASRWGLLGEGWRGGQGEVAIPSKGMALWQFRWHAAYVWALLQLWRAVREPDEHRSRLLLPALWWLAGIPQELPSSGPLPGIRRSDRGTQGFQRISTIFEGRTHPRQTEVQRAAQLLDSLLSIEMAGVRPRTVYATDEAGQPHLTASFTTDTLLQAILALVYLDVTGQKDIGECARPTCAGPGPFFTMSKRQRTLVAAGKGVYCCHEHAVGAASRGYAERNPDRVRAQARERQRRHRAKQSRKPVRATAKRSRTSRPSR